MKINRVCITAFLVLSFFSLATASVFSCSYSRKVLMKQIINHLETVASVQKSRLEGLVEQNLERLALVTSRTPLRLFLVEYMVKPEQTHQMKMNKILADAQKSIPCVRQLNVLSPEELVAFR